MSACSKDSSQTGFSSHTIAGCFPCSTREGVHIPDKGTIDFPTEGDMWHPEVEPRLRPCLQDSASPFPRGPDCSDSLCSCSVCAGNVSSTALYKHPYLLLSLLDLFIDQSQGTSTLPQTDGEGQRWDPQAVLSPRSLSKKSRI